MKAVTNDVASADAIAITSAVFLALLPVVAIAIASTIASVFIISSAKTITSAGINIIAHAC